MSAPRTPTPAAPVHEQAGQESSPLEPASLAQAGGAQVRSFPPTDGRPSAGTEPEPPSILHGLSGGAGGQALPGERFDGLSATPVLQALRSAYDPGSASALIDLVEERWQEIAADSAALDFVLALIAQGHVIPADFSPEVGDAIRAHAPPILSMQGEPRDATAIKRPVRDVPQEPDPAAKLHPAPTKVDLSARQDETAVDRRPMTMLGPQDEIEGVTIEAKDETPWDRSQWQATGIEGMVQRYTSKQHGGSFSIMEVGNMSGGNDYYYHEPGKGKRWIPFSPPAPRDFTADLQAEIRRQQLLLDITYDVGMQVYLFATMEAGGLFTGIAGLATRQGAVRVSASKVAAKGAEAAIAEARIKVAAGMTEEAAEEWISAGRRYHMALAEETVEEATERLARYNGLVKATGQNHHILTNKVMRALDEHETLAGVFKRDDKRFQFRAKDAEAHKGYDEWHREIDDEVVLWIKKEENKKATPQDFIRYLHDLYQQPLHRSRIPNVNLMNIEP
jgi:hypothetical protein